MAPPCSHRSLFRKLLSLFFGRMRRPQFSNSYSLVQDPATIAFILDHGESNFLITDTEFSPAVKEALKKVREKRKITVIDIRDSEAEYLHVSTLSPHGMSMRGIAHKAHVHGARARIHIDHRCHALCEFSCALINTSSLTRQRGRTGGQAARGV